MLRSIEWRERHDTAADEAGTNARDHRRWRGGKLFDQCVDSNSEDVALYDYTWSDVNQAAYGQSTYAIGSAGCYKLANVNPLLIDVVTFLLDVSNE